MARFVATNQGSERALRSQPHLVCCGTVPLEPELLFYVKMYVPPQFEEHRPEILHAHMGRYPLATVVAATSNGIQANHIPLFFEPGTEGLGKLKGHIARANSLWRDVRAGSEVLAIFQGASHYISPNWYRTKRENGKVVPTWNYTTVHARGPLTWTHDATWLRKFLEVLTNRYESHNETPWRIDDAPEAYIERMLAAIVGFEIAIQSLTGKWKLSQNRDMADRAGVASALQKSGDPGALEMAALVASTATEGSEQS